MELRRTRPCLLKVRSVLPSPQFPLSAKLDTDEGKRRRTHSPCPSGLGIAEPVFGNICGTRGLRRFSLRGKRKVNTQWLLYCMVHNIGKVHRYASAHSKATKAARRACGNAAKSMKQAKREPPTSSPGSPAHASAIDRGGGTLPARAFSTGSLGVTMKGTLCRTL